MAIAPVIERCKRCGFDIAFDSLTCAGCRRVAGPPGRAARQVAGLALPTRSVHRLPRTVPTLDAPARPAPSPDAARSAFAFTSLLALVVLLGLVLGWAARMEAFVLTLPVGTAARIDELTMATAWATVGVAGIGAVALGTWWVRRAR